MPSCILFFCGGFFCGFHESPSTEVVDFFLASFFLPLFFSTFSGCILRSLVLWPPFWAVLVLFGLPAGRFLVLGVSLSLFPCVKGLGFSLGQRVVALTRHLEETVHYFPYPFLPRELTFPGAFPMQRVPFGSFRVRLGGRAVILSLSGPS